MKDLGLAMQQGLELDLLSHIRHSCLSIGIY